MKVFLFLVLAAFLIGAFSLRRLDYLEVDAQGVEFRASTNASPGIFDACRKLGGRVEGPFVGDGKGRPDYQCRASISWVLVGLFAVGLGVVAGFAARVTR